MPSFEPAAYGPVFGELLSVDRCQSLDEGSPSTVDRQQLDSLDAEQAFAHTAVHDQQSAQCCLSALWLLYDFLDESHTISQSIATVEGSFWHGIMHRREGDFSNAKYWFRKVGQHPIYDLLAAEEFSPAGEWDPYDFVDACESALHGQGDQQLCRQLQQREWELLFDHCYTLATSL